MSDGSETTTLAEQLSDGELLDIELCDDVCVVRFIEPMLRDADRPQRVKHVLGKLARHYDRFIINMTSVEYCSSLVLGALVLLRNTVDEAGGRVHMCGVTGQVGELFDITGMDTLFSLFETEAEALADFNHS